MNDFLPPQQAGRTLRIGVDGFNLALARGTGVATYARTLTQCLKGLGHRVDVVYGMNISARMSPALREVVFFDSLGGNHGPARAKFLSKRWIREVKAELSGHRAVEVPITGNVEARGFRNVLPSYDRILNVPWLFQAATRHFRRTGRFLDIRIDGGPEIMHWTYPLPIRLAGARNVYTIHDIVPLTLPYTTLDDKGFHFRLIRTLVREADHLCTVSEASARDLVSFFPSAANKLTNTYQSFSPPGALLARSQEEVVDEVRRLFNLEQDGYYLFFGSLEPKKNVGRVIEAYLTSGVEVPLVLVGAQAWKSEQELRFLKTAQSRPRRARVITHEYLPLPLLLSLIRGARAVLFPSLNEGFGLPVLEAMMMGTPVLTSREGSLPEVGGDVAVYVDAYDASDIARGIRALDADPALRDRLRAAGPAQAASFDMAAYATRLTAMYSTVLGAR